MEHFLQSRHDRATFRVSENDDESRVEPRGRELDAADLRGCDNVARNTDDEEVAQPLVENDLGGYPRI